MVRNLGKMTAIGLLKPFSDARKLIVRKLKNEAALKRSRIHPLAVLVAQKIYAQGHGDKGALKWSPVSAVVDALDEATLRTQILLTTHSADMLDNPTIKPENVRVVQLVDGKTIIGPVDEASIEIIARKLNTLGALERENQLEPDLDDQDRQQHLSRNGVQPQG